MSGAGEPPAPRLRASPAGKALTAWFETRGWKPFAFQRKVWRAIQDVDAGGTGGAASDPTGGIPEWWTATDWTDR